MDISEVIAVGLGLLNALLAIVIGRYIPSFWKRLPWLIPLAIYFLARSIRRIGSVMTDTVRDSAWDIAIDLVLAVTLVVLVLNARTMLAGFAHEYDEAELRRREYDRARVEYEQLMRHRIGNPLAVLVGGVTTLQHVDPLPADTRAKMLADMADAAERIEQASLSTDPISEEERGLLGQPRLSTEND